MKNLAGIDDNKDVVTKDYVDGIEASIDSEYDSNTYTVTLIVNSYNSTEEEES